MSEVNGNTAIAYDGSIVDLSDIPEVKSFKGWRKNPHAGEYVKDGKMRARVHFEDRIELQEFDAETLEIVSIKVIEHKTGGQVQEDKPEKQEPSGYTEWRSGIQNENISARELSRLAMAEQKV